MTHKRFFLFLLSIFILLPLGAQDRALFFAVQQYDHEAVKPLKHPVGDAKEIAEKLEVIYGFTTEVVENPSLDLMVQKLRAYEKNYASGVWGSESRLLLFFSGHGQVEHRNGYFLPADADPARLYRTAFAYFNWAPFIDNLQCKHILVAIDACYSGTFDPNWWNGQKAVMGRPGEISQGDLLIANHERYTTRQFMTSATETKTPDKSKFAKKFIEGLLSRGGDDGILTSTELFAYLEDANPVPYRGEFGKDEPESSYLFIASNREQMQTEGPPPEERVVKLENEVDDLTGQLINVLEGKYIRQNEVFKELSESLTQYVTRAQELRRALSRAEQVIGGIDDLEIFNETVRAYNESWILVSKR